MLSVDWSNKLMYSVVFRLLVRPVVVHSAMQSRCSVSRCARCFKLKKIQRDYIASPNGFLALSALPADGGV